MAKKSKYKSKKKKQKYFKDKSENLSLKLEINAVEALAESFLESEDMELVHLEYQRESRGRVLRFYIDKPGGVTIDDCAYVNRQLGDLMDVKIKGNEAYILEVSSPGLNRRLKKIKDFMRFKGEKVVIKTKEFISGQKKFKGLLMDASEKTINIKVEDRSIEIPYETVTKARLDF
ncbi:Ribosome maturation factor RimP [Candidatus Magnetomoraceae bacterium gMMP-15]